MSVDILIRTPPAADARLSYGPDPLQFVEVRLPHRPSKELLPTLINIHGGFWRSPYDLVHAGHLCAALTRAGLATFNVEYRRVGDSGGGWPGSFDDVIGGFDFVRGLTTSHRLDPNRLLVMGHSAGAELALCLAGQAPGLHAAISLAGVLDLRRAFGLHLSKDAVKEFLGGSPAQVAEHYREASPMECAIPKSVRQLIVHGAKDDAVPADFSRDYVSQKRKRGETVQLLELPEAGHFDVIDPMSKAWTRIERAVLELVT